MCGDVEANPGPSDHEILLQLLQGQQNMTATLNNVLTKQAKVETDLADLTKRISGIESLSPIISTLKNEVEGLKSEVLLLHNKNSELTRIHDEQENRSRRNNLVIFGIDEPSGETKDGLLGIIKDDLFQKKLELSINGIERCHRLGKKTNGQGRPVIIKLLDYREKVLILKSCSKLKGSVISVTEDFSMRVREIRKKLWLSSSEERNNGAKAKLVFDKLAIGDTMYAWDEVTNTRHKITRKGK